MGISSRQIARLAFLYLYYGGFAVSLFEILVFVFVSFKLSKKQIVFFFLFFLEGVQREAVLFTYFRFPAPLGDWPRGSDVVVQQVRCRTSRTSFG